MSSENKAKEVIVVMRDEIEQVSLESNKDSESEETKAAIRSELKHLFLNRESPNILHSHTSKQEATSNNFSLSERRNNLLAWLKANHLPVTVDANNVINILDSVYIQAPYDLDDCLSTNEIILDKVRELVKSLAQIKNNASIQTKNDTKNKNL